MLRLKHSEGSGWAVGGLGACPELYLRKQKKKCVYVLFFSSQTVGVRSQKTRWLYAARRGDFRGIFKYFVAILEVLKKKAWVGAGVRYPNFGKDLGFCILVKSSQYKGEVRNSKFEKLIGLWAGK